MPIRISARCDCGRKARLGLPAYSKARTLKLRKRVTPKTRLADKLNVRQSRSGPAGRTHLAWGWPTCTRGTRRRPGSVRQYQIEHGPIRVRRVQGGPAHLVLARLASVLEPSAALGRCGPTPRRAAGRRQHRGSRWTSAVGDTGRGARTASRPCPTVLHSQHDHVRQSRQQLADAPRLADHRGSSSSVETIRLVERPLVDRT
jgi:hypothetical protein